MPYTLNGFGTHFYGNRDTGPDGSYVTTLWVTALYVPLFPLASYRVLRTGKSTNYVVHRSQGYVTQRVPTCWRQVWNIYLVGSPLILAILYFSWPSIQQSFQPKEAQEPLFTAQSSASQPFDPRRDNPLFDKIHPAPLKPHIAAAEGPCGKVLKLDSKEAFERMNVVNTISKLLDGAGFTSQDFDRFGLPRPKMADAVSQAYGFGYIVWNSPGANSEADFEQLVDKAVNSAKPSTDEETAATRKFRNLMLKAFDLGLYDANRNPCPF